MKQRDLLKTLRAHAKRLGLDLELIEGGKHIKVKIGDMQTTIPRHTEINEFTAKAILKQMGVEQ